MLIPIPRLRARRRCFIRDKRGAVSIIGAFLMILGIGLSAIIIDVGHLYLTKRRLQAAVDAAALAGAGEPGSAASIVAAALARSGYSSDATVEAGVYTADPALAVNARFAAGGSQINAVRVTKTVTAPTILAGAFGASALSQVKATATAARIPAVAFAAGTGLASINNGALNDVLGGLLGANLSLSLVNYQALANTNVDALTFLDQLAIQAGLTAGSYGDLANTSVTMGQMIAAARAALNIHPGGNNTAALDALNLVSLQTPASVSALLSSVVNTALWQKRQIGSIVQQTPGRTAINLFDLVSATARIYGGGHLVTSNSAVSLPLTGTSVRTRLTVGSPMTAIAVGGVGTTVSTSQVRLALTVTALNINLGVANVTVSLPVYLQVASGQAQVAAIPCTSGGTMTSLSAASQAAQVQLGTVTDSGMTNFGASPTVTPATVATVSVLGIPVAINGSASAAVAAGAPTQLDFTQADITAGAVKTAAGSDAGHVFSRLASNLTLTAAFSGGALTSAINNTLNVTVVPLLRTTLVTLLSALDPAADTLLRALGLRLGAIDTVVHGVSCGVPTLVR